MITDLTAGKPAKLLWRFSLPMLLSVLFQQIYSISDSIIAGNFCGMEALAAIGASFAVTNVFMAIAQGCNMGCCVVISQLFGAKDIPKMKTAVYTSLIGILTISLVLTVTGLLIAEPALVALDTPGDIMQGSMTYFNIYIYGMFFLFLYNICNGIFVALGDSKTPLFFLIISSVGNVLFDLLFVAVFNRGIAGAAWATFLCQGLCAVGAFAVLMVRIRKIPCKDKFKFFSFSMLGKISRISIPSIFQQSFVSVGNMLIQSIINGYGPAVMAGFASAVKMNVLALSCFSALSNGVSSFTAQNIGAGRADRVKQGFRSSVVMVLIVAAVFSAIYLIFAPNLIGLFLDTSVTDSLGAIEAGRRFLSIVSPFYFAVSLKLVADGVLKGNGSMVLFMIATFTDLILRVILAYILSGFWDELGVWLSWPLGWIIGGLLSLTFALTLMKKLIAKRKLSEQNG